MMNKTTFSILLILTVMLTACGSASNAARPSSANPSTGSAGELSPALQVGLGTIKLDGTSNAVTAEQARQLLPLWETLQLLETSDTAANEEKEALIAQIQETMTNEQIQAITTLGLTRQDMFSIMQSQGLALRNGQSTNNQRGNSTNNRGRNFNPGGGPPPDGGFPGGGPGFSNNQGQRSQSASATQSSNRNTTVDPNRIPTPLIQAVIEYLKKKAGA